MQLSQNLSSAIAQIKVSNSPITNLIGCFNVGGLSSSFLPLAAVVVEERL